MKYSVYKYNNFLLLGLPFWGSDSTNRNMNLDLQFLHMSSGEGCFIGNLKYGATLQRDNVVLTYLQKNKEWFTKYPRSNKITFTSKRFVQRTMRIIKNHIVEKIVTFINAHCDGIYGVQMDTTTDTAMQNKCSIVVRYVSESLKIYQHTIAFVSVQDSTGRAMFDVLKYNLENIGLDIKKIVGSSMDGASNMNSESIGVNAYISTVSPFNIHTWCSSHRFNLVVHGAYEIISDLKKNVNDFGIFMRKSNKRIQEWIRVVTFFCKSAKDIRSTVRPQKAGTTRWWAMQKAINRIFRNVSHFLSMFISLYNSCHCKGLKPQNEDVRKKLADLFEFWTNYNNIIIGFVVDKILTRLQKSTTYFQVSGLQLAEVIPEINSCYRYLHSLLKNNKRNLASLVQDARKFIRSVEECLAKENVSALFSDQNIQSSLSLTDNCDENTYIIDTTLHSFITALMQNLQTRFLDEFNKNIEFYKELMYLSPSTLKNTDINSTQISLEKICLYNNIDEKLAINQLKLFAEEFNLFLNQKRDLEICSNTLSNDPDYCSDDSDPEENDDIYNGSDDDDETNTMSESQVSEDDDEHLSNKKKFQTDWSYLVAFLTMEESSNRYFLIKKLYRYCLTLPSTQVKCETDFSVLKAVKTPHRSSMNDESCETTMIINLARDLLPLSDNHLIIDMIANSSKQLKKHLSF